MAQDNEPKDRMQEELEDFKREQARVRQVLGRVGGKSQAKIDMAINMTILGVILALFVVETLTDWIPTLVSQSLRPSLTGSRPWYRWRSAFFWCR